MAAPGMALAAAEAGRFCMPRAAVQQLENWGDSLSGIVVTSPLTETSTDLDDSGDKHHALMVPSPFMSSCSWLVNSSCSSCNAVYCC